MNQEQINWTTDEKKLLQNEKLISEIMTIRSKEKPVKSKPIWQIFIESAGGVAIITFFLCGLVGSFLNSKIQQGLSKREFKQEMIKSSTQVYLQREKAFLEEQQKVTTDAMELLGTIIQASENFVMTRSKAFDLTMFDSLENKKKIESQVEKILFDFNKAYTNWNILWLKYSLLLDYYFSETEVKKSWEEIASAVDEFICWGQGITKENFDIMTLDKKVQEVTAKALSFGLIIGKARSTSAEKREANVMRYFNNYMNEK